MNIQNQLINGDWNFITDCLGLGQEERELTADRRGFSSGWWKFYLVYGSGRTTLWIYWKPTDYILLKD